MKLDSELHIIILDLMVCYRATSNHRVKSSLLSVINEKLSAFFDPDAQYSRSNLSVNLSANELILTLMVSCDDDDETEYHSPDVDYVVNVRTGKYKQL